MIISLIAAMSENRVIGKDNALPWDYPEDLKRFRAITRGHPIIMGRRTYESIWKPLPWRRNIVITSSEKFPEVETYTNPDNLLELLEQELGEDEQVFIIWWASLYSYYLEKADYIYMTHINEIVSWDTYFPAFEKGYEIIESEKKDNKLTFTTWRKKR